MNFYNTMNPNAGYMGGYGNFQAYQEPKKAMPKLKNLLPEEKVKEMIRNGQGSGLRLEVRSKDIERHMCTHKDNGQIVVRPNEMGDKLQCPICGEQFEMIESDLQSVQAVTDDMHDIIETIKTIGVDTPASFLTELAKMEAVMELIPGLHQMSLKKWYNEYDNSTYNNKGVGNNASQLVDFVLNGGNMGGMNPYMNPYMMNQQMGYVNPYGPQQGQPYGQPMQQGYGYNQPQQMNGYYNQPNQMNPYQTMGNQMPGAPGMNVQYPGGQFDNPFVQTAGQPEVNNQQKVAYGQPPQVDINQPVQPAKPEAAPAYQGPGAASAEKPEAVSTKKMNV